MSTADFNSSSKAAVLFDALDRAIVKHGGFSPPSYRYLVTHLKRQGIKTAWGRDWTERKLYRYLKRNGYNGIHDYKRQWAKNNIY